MKVSVIIPTYNRLATLPRAVASVIAQDYSNWELIIVDDGSTDGTVDWLRGLTDPRIRLLIRSECQGVSRARNEGAHLATGEWLAFLDSDDAWFANKLSLQLTQISSQSELRWTHGDEVWVRNGVQVNVARKYQKKGGDIFSEAVKLCCVGPSAVMIQKTFFELIGGFREDFAVCEDYDLWLKMSAVEPIGYVSQPLVIKHGGHDDQLSRRYLMMDLWRVQALTDLLRSTDLSETQAAQVRLELRQKLWLLIKGCRKHQNLQNYDVLFSMWMAVRGDEIPF